MKASSRPAEPPATLDILRGQREAVFTLYTILLAPYFYSILSGIPRIILASIRTSRPFRASPHHSLPPDRRVEQFQATHTILLEPYYYSQLTLHLEGIKASGTLHGFSTLLQTPARI
jgi:hypothetical protein